MAARPVVFISATSADLGAARDLTAKLLLSLGFDADWQDLNATHGGNLLGILRSKVDQSHAVVQLVGQRYGEEPPEAVAPFGRISYTQFEALYAETIGKKVIYIFLPPEFPTPALPPELPERTQRQAEYRKRLEQSGTLRHAAGSLLELENRILRFRDELGQIRAEVERNRRRLTTAVLIGLSLLIGIGLGVYGLQQSSRRHEAQITGVQTTTAQQAQTLVSLDSSTKEQGGTIQRIESKVEEIRNLPQKNRLERLATALAAADAEELELLAQAGVRPKEIESALIREMPGSDKSVAYEFFENGRGSAPAQDWLRKMLGAGMNPNLLLPSKYYEKKALISDALEAGNAAAVVHLLESGASPHAYRNLWLTSYPVTSFLFPYHYLAKNQRFSSEEKKQVAEAFRAHGAALFRPTPGKSSEDTTYQTMSVDDTLENAESLLGIPLQETEPSIADSPLGPAAERATGVNWREFTKDLPRRVHATADDNIALHSFEVRHFIGAFDDRFYFLGPAQARWLEYAIIEVSKDRKHWNVLVYIGPQAGMGLAKKDDDGFQPDDAWRRFDFILKDKDTMRLRDYYDWKIASTWP